MFRGEHGPAGVFHGIPGRAIRLMDDWIKPIALAAFAAALRAILRLIQPRAGDRRG